MENNVELYTNDIPDNIKDWTLNNCSYIGIDTETTGLNPIKDSLCLIQIAANERYFLIKYDTNNTYKNLTEILTNKNIKKVFHHAIFDVRFIMRHLKITNIDNVICTKIAAKLIYGLNESNSLKDLLKKHFDVLLNKEFQVSNWRAAELSSNQINYAINDVKYLVKLWCEMEKELHNKGLIKYAEKCFDFLPTQAFLNNNGIGNIFEY